MLEANAHEFYRITTILAEIATWVRSGVAMAGDKANLAAQSLTPDQREKIAGLFKALISHLEVLGAPIAAMAATEAHLTLSNPQATWSALDTHAADVQRTAYRELTKAKLLSLDSRDQRYYAPRAPLFGDLFAVRFQREGVFELDEAAKCLALGRPTAGVFHLMRLMEIGIKAVARCLQIPDPVKPAERNWGRILDKIKDELDRRWPDSADRMSGDGALFESLYQSLDAVRNPLRNATMHVEKTYTDDSAEHVFAAVRGFMFALSSRCDEEGNPKA